MRAFFDNVLAAIGTVVLHALIIYLLFTGVRWEQPPQERARTTLQAVVVSEEAFLAVEQSLPEPPAPEPEPVPQQPDPAIEQERLAREAAAKEAAEQAEQQEAQRQADAAAEQKRLADAEAERRREADEVARIEQEKQAEVEREKAAEEQRRKAEAEAARQREEAERRERERQAEAEREKREREAEAERQRRAEQRRQEELEAELLEALRAEEARAGAVDAGLLAQYIEVIRQKVERNWIRPPGVPDGIRCEVAVRQLRNGEVVSVRVVDCAGGEVLIRSIETAVRKASPLPPPKDPSLFDPNLTFPFKTGE